jgi:hypothetical protein
MKSVSQIFRKPVNAKLGGGWAIGLNPAELDMKSRRRLQSLREKDTVFARPQ